MKRDRRDYREKIQLPLLVLAGLPNPACAGIASLVEQHFRSKVIRHASGNDDARLYTDATIGALMNAVSGFAVRQLRSEAHPPVPKHILLAYVPSDDDEGLLDAFEFFVFPVRLVSLSRYDEHGRQLRHDLKVATDRVVSSLEVALHEFSDVKRRLSSISDTEPLFLPPENFHVSATLRAAGVFRAMFRQNTSWNDPVSSIQRVTVKSEDLPKVVRGGGQKRILSDTRGLVFPHDPSEHGLPRELPAECSPTDRKDIMRSYFRFGVPLRNGFHHDVQFPGRNLKGELFDCCRQGRIELSCSHANVYANDYVRPATK